MKWLSLAALVACSSKAKVEDARMPVDAAPPVQKPAGPYRVEKGPTGDAQIRVEWHDVPVVARASSGRDACGRPREAAVAPTSTWGIPDVFVAILVDHGRPLADDDPRVVLAHCTLAPRVAVAGGSIAIASAADAPVKAMLAPAGRLPFGATAAGKAIAVYLPVAGHEVSAALERGAIYRLTARDGEAWIVAADTPYVAVTDATGQVIVREIPVGTYAISAWLPAREGQPAKLGHGQVTITAGVLAEVAVDLAKP